MKKNKTKLKFPSIYRTITEKINKPRPRLFKFYAYFSIFLTLVVTIFLVVLIGFISINLYQNFTKYESLHAQRQNLVSRINFWNSIAEKYPGYPDAYLNIASLYFELNELNSARKYVDQALLLNPDYEKAKILEEKISQKGY
ncbi:MAG: tetratricopeptide repeat protein [Candidatus Levybacteria bacterium]|nr:tetratricopeptide repeat protein [Candidatus Levybacteria bacterium]